MAVDENGNVYVTGKSNTWGTHFDYATIKYSGTGVEENTKCKTQDAKLEIQPNPFIQSTTVKYYIPTNSNVSLSLYDIAGRSVNTIYSGIHEKGYYDVELKGEHMGSPLQAGIYFLRLETGEFKLTRKLTIFK